MKGGDKVNREDVDWIDRENISIFNQGVNNEIKSQQVVPQDLSIFDSSATKSPNAHQMRINQLEKITQDQKKYINQIRSERNMLAKHIS